ncbi:MAG TPA: RdgB/HAM1 family non-canonical purine NTP pyrophosphatase [Thermotogaceae bacterium]|nr:RdgB/HAM1 family non-canonical purine NTP pyrophosphatase [Thermotogaceae bacterium]
MKILIATWNDHKFEEILQIMGDTNISFLSLRELGIKSEVDEDYNDYLYNSIKKAREFARISNIPTLADDSGLEIDCIDKYPGPLSARFFEGFDYKIKMKWILKMMKNVKDEDRTARFVCAASLYDPVEEKVYSTIGKVEGKIAREIRGENGFGYDPIFIPNGLNKTFGELPSETKNKMSHRYIAFKKMKELLLTLYA